MYLLYKNFFIAILSLFLIFSLSSCAANQPVSSSANTENILSATSKVQTEKSAPKITYQATPKTAPKQMGVYSAELSHFTPENIADILLNNSSLEFKQDIDGMFSYTDNNQYVYFDKNLFYHKTEFDYYDQFFTFEAEEDKDLPFCSIADMSQNLLSTLSMLGIKNCEIRKIHTMDYDFIKRQKERWEKMEESLPSMMGKSDHSPSNTEQGCYRVELLRTIEQIPIYPETQITGNGFVIEGTKIEVFYNEDGITSLIIPSQYITTQEKIIEPISPEKIKLLIQQKFDKIILTKDIYIESMELMYLPQLPNREPPYQLTPVWVVQAFEGNVRADKETLDQIGSDPNAFFLYFNAASGKEIILENDEMTA